MLRSTEELLKSSYICMYLTLEMHIPADSLLYFLKSKLGDFTSLSDNDVVAYISGHNIAHTQEEDNTLYTLEEIISNNDVVEYALSKGVNRKYLNVFIYYLVFIDKQKHSVSEVKSKIDKHYIQ